jgi:hypothetical protein
MVRYMDGEIALGKSRNKLEIWALALEVSCFVTAIA